jgi:hypothetical protein
LETIAFCPKLNVFLDLVGIFETFETILFFSANKNYILIHSNGPKVLSCGIPTVQIHLVLFVLSQKNFIWISVSRNRKSVENA